MYFYEKPFHSAFSELIRKVAQFSKYDVWDINAGKLQKNVTIFDQKDIPISIKISAILRFPVFDSVQSYSLQTFKQHILMCPHTEVKKIILDMSVKIWV